jgi:hypothetical protein
LADLANEAEDANKAIVAVETVVANKANNTSVA